MCQLSRIPKGYPIGWVDAPDVYYQDTPGSQHCGIQGCTDQPRFEIYHGPWVADVPLPRGIPRGWWYVCLKHRDWLVANCEAGKNMEAA